jgi:predicted metal-dependent peptidase
VSKKQQKVHQQNEKYIFQGKTLVEKHPLFMALAEAVFFVYEEMDSNSWGIVASSGMLSLNKVKKATPGEWAYIIAHCLLHLGLNHKQQKENQDLWNVACDCYIANFLAELKFGNPPREMSEPIYEPISSEEKLYERFCREGVPENYKKYSTIPGKSDFVIINEKPDKYFYNQPVDFPMLFAKGLSRAVQSAVNVAGGVEVTLSGSKVKSEAEKAKSWFMSSYPLLGALASDFEIIDDPIVCTRMDISVAAISVHTKEIYINSSVSLTEEEMKFLIAHELLHAGLAHAVRRQGRDPYLWNVACDYVINSWLIDMKVGDMPQIGGLYDPELKGLSAESIYDRIVTDLRIYRKLRTFRGMGSVDIIETKSPDFWEGNKGIELDEFYRRALSQGLSYHFEQGRGYLPEGLIEEIRSLSQPPIPWDVELAKWFDRFFQPIEKVRTYARPSRRQASTPDIARPKWISISGEEDGRTFAVLVDTSGSMDRELLGKALGTIASYSIARDVPLVRVIFCDAIAYDAGYLPPESLLEKVKVKGRGGTVLQPGVNLIDLAEDFPKNGPILIITDGECDRLSIKREHAFVMPQGAKLPFIPRGQVFRMR